MKKENLVFIESLHTLLENGCTVRESLELLVSENKNGAISRAALHILDKMRKGESLAPVLIESILKNDSRYYPYILQFGQSGNIEGSLRLILDDEKRRSDCRKKLTQSLIYPLCIIAIVTVYLILLFLEVIPWMARAGLIQDAAMITGMRRGTGTAIVFLLISSFTFTLASLLVFRKKTDTYAFWAMLVALSDSGFTFDQALGICARTIRIPYSREDGDHFFDSEGIDLFTHTTLLTASLTGNYEGAFKSILVMQRSSLENLYALFGKISEPSILLIAGIVIMIIAFSVFLPVLTAAGGIA